MTNYPSFELHNGVTIPYLGYGTWQIPNKEAYDCVYLALKNGYTHIDTALAYRNEENVGKAISDFDINREDLFVTSKLPAGTKGYNETLEAFEETLDNLGLDYLDLYLIHAPRPWNDKEKDYTEGNIQSWKAMEKLYRDGKIRSIGVSNFSETDIQALLDSCDIVPMVNQIKFYIGRKQEPVLKFCKQHQILVEAYSPLATGDILNSPEIQQIAEKYNATSAQICIRYCLDKNTLPLPKTTHEERMVENSQLDFVLSSEDLDTLDAVADVRSE